MRKKPMLHKLAGTYTVMVILLMGVLAVAFCQYSYYTIYTDSVGNLNQLSSSTMNQIDSRLKALDEAAVSLASSQEFLRALQQMQDEPAASQESVELVKNMTMSACVKKQELRRVAVMLPNGFFYSTGTLDDDAATRVPEHMSKFGVREDNRKFFLQPHLDTWNRESDVQVYSLIKPVRDSRTQTIGYLELQENMQYLQKICDNKWNDISLGTLILDESNEVFYTNLERTEKNQRLIDEALEVSNTFAPRIKNTDNAVISICNSNFNYFKTVLILEKSVMYHTVNSTLSAVISMGLLLILLTCLFIFFSARAITAPINRLVERMENTDLTNIRQHIEIAGVRDHETEVLVHAFNRMTNRLESSITKQKLMQNAQSKALFSALQSTIRPHFLYNTLGSIANMCEDGESASAADACYCLSDILRYASDYATDEVNVADEMHNLNSYLSIMKSRYRQRLEYICTMDTASASFILPKMTVQPLVENAIKYSLMERETVLVTVDICVRDGELLLSVMDNGCGISAEKQREIEEKVGGFLADMPERDITQPLKFGGMGLIGTLLRLTIYFGDNFRYTISSGTGEGTRILLAVKDEPHLSAPQQGTTKGKG